VNAPRKRAPLDEALAVNRFWFGPAPLGLHTLRDREKLWFGVSTTGQQQAAIDEMIRERFGALMQRAAADSLVAWAASPHRRLALILLLDQFPRNVFRGTARAFDTDAQALALALSGIQAGAEAALSPLERVFLCMPLQHAERLQRPASLPRCGCVSPLGLRRRRGRATARPEPGPDGSCRPPADRPAAGCVHRRPR